MLFRSPCCKGQLASPRCQQNETRVSTPIYLDYNASTPLLPEAAAAVGESLALCGNPSSVHAAGRTARAVVEDAREAVARLGNVSPAQVIFTSGATEANALALSGARVLASAVEHPSVLAWSESTIPVAPSGVVDLGALQAVPEADVLAVMLANNETGVLQPVLVRPVGPGRYEIIAGERRFRAARLAGLAEVPVLVREVPDQAAAVMALIENMQREDLNPLEEAQGLQRLVQEFSLTHEQAAQAVGRSRSAASNLLRLLQLSPSVQKMLLAGDLEMGHARALLSLESAAQVQAAQEVVARKLSVRDTEKLVAKTLNNGRQAPLLRVKQEKSRDLVRLEEQLADVLAAAVDIRVHRKTKRGEQGEIAIAFGSLDELNGLLEKLGIAEE